MKIDSSNLTRLKRRFIAADEAFIKRFTAENKYLGVEITQTHSNCQINCQFDCEITTESKAANIDYQYPYSTEAEIAEAFTIINEINTN